jgi:hypothetical protein
MPRARDEADAEDDRGVERADVAGRRRDERRDVRERHHVQPVEQAEVHAGHAAEDGVDAALHDPERHRQHEQRGAARAPEPP